MSLLLIRTQIGQLQSTIAQLQSKKQQIQSDRSRLQEDQAQRKLMGMEDYGFPDLEAMKESMHRRILAEIEADLVRSQSELQLAQQAWMEYLSRLPEKVVVLFFAANPLHQPQLRLDEEARAIAEMIRKAKHRDAVKFESCWAVRPLDVLQALNEHQPRIVHFSGHGLKDDIIFQNGEGEAQWVSKDAIVKTIESAAVDLQLAFFNTCHSSEQAQAVVKHIHAAIGMNTAIGDKAARVFAAQFYSGIGFGLSVRRAFEQAQAALLLEGIDEHTTPELFVADGMSADDLILVRPLDVEFARLDR